MIQPGVIQIGNDFFIKIGKKHSQLENANLKSALSFLLAHSYILSIEYPLPIKFVFLFLEAFADLPLSIK
jgi:integral membrane sensor domain MASE1